MRLTTTLALLLAAGASAAPSPAMLVKESVAAPRGWMRRGDVPAGTTIPLSFALKQRGAAELEAALLAVSDPASARYGQHLTRDDVAALLAPAPEAQQAVRRWMASHGIEESEVLDQVLLARTPVKRLVEPEEVAGLVGFLCGPGTASINGSSYLMDGGWTAA